MAISTKHFVDLTPLRISDSYRALWASTFLSNIGAGMASVAIGLQVYRITDSSFAVGLIGLFQFVPLVTFGLLGGSWADRLDRRRLALTATLGLMACALALGLTTQFEVATVGVLYLIVAFQSAFFGIGAPARQSTVPRLLPADQLAKANALSTFAWNFGATIGPMLGGFIIASANSIAIVYFIEAAFFLLSLSLVRKLPPLPPTGEVSANHLHALKDGFNFLRERPHIKMNLYIDIVAMVFGLPRALFPAIATAWYPTDPAGAAMAVGVLSAAVTAGAVISSLLSGRIAVIYRHGAAVILSVVAWGLTIVLFGLSPNIWVGAFALAAAGAADNISAIFRTTIMQASVPDEYRGRLQGVYTVVVAGGPRLGDLESGSVAAWQGETVSVISGGVLCLVGAALLVARYRGYWSYDARIEEAN